MRAVLVRKCVHMNNVVSDFFPSPNPTQRSKQINSMFSMKIDIQEITAAIAKTQKKYNTECCNLNYPFIKAVSASVPRF